MFRGLAEQQSADAELRSEGWTGLGIVQMTRGEYHPARISFLRAIRLDRRNAAAYYHLGLLYRDAPFGYNEAALEQFDIFVRLAAEASPRVQKVQRSVIPGLKESIARASAERPGAAKRDSAASAKAQAAAEAAWAKRNYKTAKAKYQEALTADALNHNAAKGLAKAWLKTDSGKTGKQKAFEYYRTACALRPGAVADFLEAGKLAMQLGLPAQAAEIYSRALAASPSSLDATDGLIRAYRKSGGKERLALANAYQLYRDALPKARK